MDQSWDYLITPLILCKIEGFLKARIFYLSPLFKTLSSELLVPRSIPFKISHIHPISVASHVSLGASIFDSASFPAWFLLLDFFPFQLEKSEFQPLPSDKNLLAYNLHPSITPPNHLDNMEMLEA